MNKKMIRIAGWALGLSMAVAGIGVAIGTSAKEVMETRAAEGQLSTLIFGGGAKTQSYTSSFAETDSADNGWTIGNFNNNDWKWAGSTTGADKAIKCGRKNYDSVAYIQNSAELSNVQLTKVELSITAVTSANVNSIKVYGGATSSSITTELASKTSSFSTGTTTLTIPEVSQAEFKFYKIAFDMASGTSNGLLTLDKVVFFKDFPESAADVTGVEITHGMSKTTYTSSDSEWSANGIETEVTVDGGGDYEGLVTYTFAPENPTAALMDENWNGKVSIIATADGVDSEPYVQSVTVTWDKGSYGLPYTVSEANENYQKSKVVYITGYIAYINGTNYWITDDFATAKLGTLDTSSAEGKASSWELYDWSSAPSGIALGDKVTVTGTMTTYSDQNEFSRTTTLVSHTSNAMTAFRATAIAKTHYENESIVVSDFTFEADYGSETAVAITSGVTITSVATKYSAGSNSITFSYTERGVTKTSTINVTAEEDTRAVDHLSISGSMSGKNYYDDEDWDTSVLSFALVFEDDSTLPVAADSPFLDYEFQDGDGDPVSSPVAGMTSVFVYALYDDGDNQLEQTYELTGFTVTAVAVTSLNWENRDVAFEVGDHFSLKGTITARYNKSDYDTEIHLGDTGVVVTLGGTPVSSSTVLSLADHGKELVVSYKGQTVSATISVARVITASSTISAIATAGGWEVSSGSGTKPCHTSFDLDPVINISTNGDPNCGSYWADGWRVYQAQSGDIVVSVKNATLYELYSVKFTFTVGNSGRLFDSESEALSSGVAHPASGSSETYLVGKSGSGNNGQIKVSAIEVKYSRKHAGRVQAWVNEYLNFDGISAGDGAGVDTGTCETNYLKAKKALVALDAANPGVIEELKTNTSDFSEALARYNKWAEHMHDASPFAGTEIVAGSGVNLGIHSSSAMPLVVTVAALGTAAAAGFFFFQRKRKEF